MIKIETKTVKLEKIKLNLDNPRTITGQAMANLVKSLQDFPDMMKLREIVVDETMTVLGGNMRLLALQKIKAKDCMAKIVKGLTAAQKREFVIKDNSQFGAWDMNALANSWDDLPLIEWGIDLSEAWIDSSGLLDNTNGNGDVQEDSLSGKIIIPKQVWFDSKKSLMDKIKNICKNYGVIVEWPK